MKKNKGFTLIELLGVVIILGILLAIAVPSITKYLKRGTTEYYHSLENDIKVSGMDYLETYRTLLPKQIGNVVVIELDELVSNNYIDKVIDEDGNSCSGQITAKKIDSGKYEYYSCLKCGDRYITEGDNCKFSEMNNQYIDQDKYRLEVEKDYYIVNQTDPFDLPLGKVYYNDQLIDNKLEGSPNKINTDVLGKNKVIYYYHGVRKEITVEVVDIKSPSKPQIVLKKDNENGESYLSTTWYSGDIYQLFKSTDYTKTGVQGSGVKEYQISVDGEQFITLNSNNKLDTEGGEYKYYVRSVDNSGNISEVNNYTVKIDKEAPECSLKVTSGTLGTNGWYISNVEIGFDTITETDSDILFKNISTTSITANVKDKLITATVTDKAGNIGTCSITVNVDKETPQNPTITPSDGIASGKWHNKTFNLSFSGGKNISGNTYYYSQQIDNPTAEGSIVGCPNETQSYLYYVKVCSKAGLCSESSNYEVKLDKQAPNVPTSTVRYDSSTGTVRGNSSAWTNRSLWWGNFTAVDNGPPSGISHYQYSTGCTGNASGTLSTSHFYSTNLNATYCIRAVDNAGNASSWSSAYYFRVDKTAPVLSGLSNSSGGNLTSSPITIKYNIQETGSGISQCQYKYASDQYGYCNDWCKGDGTISNNTYSEVYSAARNTTTYLRCVDNAGNVSNVLDTPIKIGTVSVPVNLSVRKVASDSTTWCQGNSTIYYPGDSKFNSNSGAVKVYIQAYAGGAEFYQIADQWKKDKCQTTYDENCIFSGLIQNYPSCLALGGWPSNTPVVQTSYNEAHDLWVRACNSSGCTDWVYIYSK